MVMPQQYQARLSDREDYNDRYSQYRFDLVQPLTLENVAGQYVLLQIDEKTTRAYSMSDRPDVQTTFELLVDHQPNGVGTNYLRNLAFGATIKMMAPLGQFVIRDNPEVEQLVFVASGSGIAPIKSMLTDQLQNKNDQRTMTLFWGMRHDADLFWLDFFNDLETHFSNFNFVPVISQPSPNWRLATGHITDYLKKLDLKTKTQFYLCGNAKMMTETKEILHERAVAEEEIITEKFAV